jgi:hypothetical protein
MQVCFTELGAAFGFVACQGASTRSSCWTASWASTTSPLFFGSVAYASSVSTNSTHNTQHSRPPPPPRETTMAKPSAVLLLLALAYCCLVAQAFLPAAPVFGSRARVGGRFATALEAVKDAKSPEEFDKVRGSCLLGRREALWVCAVCA